MKRLSFQILLGVLVLLLAASAPPMVTGAAAGTPSKAEASAQTKKKPAQKKKTKVKKPAPAKQAEPGKPKEPWQLPMTVVVVRQIGALCEPLCPEWIAAEGEITAATPALFRKVLKQLGKRKLPVLIQSPGGNVNAALEIGRILRKAQLDVTVSGVAYQGCAPHVQSCRPPAPEKGVYRGTPWGRGYCASACPLILAGGVNRLASPDAGIGLHQVRTTWTQEHVRYQETYRIKNGKKKVISRKVISRKNKSYTKDGLDKRLRKQLTAYLVEMGISPSMLEDMEKAPHSDIHWLQPQRARDVALITSHYAGVGVFDLLRMCGAANPKPNCVARAFEMTPPEPGAEMIVTRMRTKGACEPFCPEWIAADGVIMPDTPKKFAAILKDLGNKKLPVFINATHGDLDAALEIGRMIREKQLVTAAAATEFIGCGPRDAACAKDRSPAEPYEGRIRRFGECSRECILVLAGGTERYPTLAAGTEFPPPESLFSRKTGGAAVEEVETYLRDMSISPELLRLARTGTVNKPVRLSAADIRVFRLVTKQSSPDFMTDPVSCKGASPAPNCVARVSPPPPVSPEAEMTVVRVRAKGKCGTLCPEWISAQGMITKDTPERFRKLLGRAGAAKLPVILDSKGGDLDAALAIGRMIRAKGLVTAIGSTEVLGCKPRDKACNKGRSASRPYTGFAYSRGDCSGACLFVLAGGTRRFGYWITTAELPAPETFYTGQAAADAPGLIEGYLSEMGISSRLLARLRSTPAPLVREDMLSFGLSTGVEAPDDVTGSPVCRANPTPSHCIRRDKSS